MRPELKRPEKKHFYTYPAGWFVPSIVIIGFKSFLRFLAARLLLLLLLPLVLAFDAFWASGDCVPFIVVYSSNLPVRDSAGSVF